MWVTFWFKLSPIHSILGCGDMIGVLTTLSIFTNLSLIYIWAQFISFKIQSCIRLNAFSASVISSQSSYVLVNTAYYPDLTYQDFVREIKHVQFFLNHLYYFESISYQIICHPLESIDIDLILWCIQYHLHSRRYPHYNHRNQLLRRQKPRPSRIYLHGLSWIYVSIFRFRGIQLLTNIWWKRYTTDVLVLIRDKV